MSFDGSDLLAAAGSIDLEPPIGLWMSGFGARLGPSIGRLDPIMARAVVVSNGGPPAVIVAVDCVGLAPESVVRLRSALSGLGIPPERCLLSATHTHSGPATMAFRGVMGRIDPAWLAQAEARIVSLVGGLFAQLEPAQAFVGSTRVEGVGFNRQDRSKPIDHELLTLQLRGAQGQTVATIFSHGLHPVILGPPNVKLSSEWPGAACRTVKDRCGGTALFLQGACGDVNPTATLTESYDPTDAGPVAEVGTMIGAATVEAAQLARCAIAAPVAGATQTVTLALQPVEALGPLDELRRRLDEDVDQARRDHDEVALSFASAMVEWHDALAQAIECGNTGSIEAEVQALRIGETLFVAMPFEPYSDVGLAIKRELAPSPVFVCGYSNGLFGYLATDWARDQGGYGPEGSHRWFPDLPMPLAKGTDVQVVECAVRLARSCLE